MKVAINIQADIQEIEVIINCMAEDENVQRIVPCLPLTHSPGPPRKTKAALVISLLYYRLRSAVLWLIMFQVKPANLNEVHD